MSEQAYVMGHSETEMRRLMLQAEILKPITTRLLRAAGIARGMRVLDLGTGSGDVAMLAAELVGPDGAVVGVDRSVDALDLAEQRARAMAHDNISFREGDVSDFVDELPYDMVIGRYVLIHQDDPTGFLRAAAANVRTGGALALHEIFFVGACPALPQEKLWEGAWDWMFRAFHLLLKHPDVAGRMMQVFHNAGLDYPTMFCETPIGGGPDSPLYAWVTQTNRTLMTRLGPRHVELGPDLGLATLERRIRDAAVAVHAQVQGPKQICAWLKL